jgi:hypothetical protein
VILMCMRAIWNPSIPGLVPFSQVYVLFVMFCSMPVQVMGLLSIETINNRGAIGAW